MYGKIINDEIIFCMEEFKDSNEYIKNGWLPIELINNAKNSTDYIYKKDGNKIIGTMQEDVIEKAQPTEYEQKLEKQIIAISMANN